MLFSLIMLLAVASAVVLGMRVAGNRARQPVLDLGAPEEKRRRSAMRLRALGVLAVILARGPIRVYLAARPSTVGDAVAVLVLCISLGLVLLSVWLYPKWN